MSFQNVTACRRGAVGWRAPRSRARWGLGGGDPSLPRPPWHYRLVGLWTAVPVGLPQPCQSRAVRQPGTAKPSELSSSLPLAGPDPGEKGLILGMLVGQGGWRTWPHSGWLLRFHGQELVAESFSFWMHVTKGWMLTINLS